MSNTHSVPSAYFHITTICQCYALMHYFTTCSYTEAPVDPIPDHRRNYQSVLLSLIQMKLAASARRHGARRRH